MGKAEVTTGGKAVGFCAACGTGLRAGSRFCPGCGSPTETGGAAPAAPRGRTTAALVAMVIVLAAAAVVGTVVIVGAGDDGVDTVTARDEVSDDRPDSGDDPGPGDDGAQVGSVEEVVDPIDPSSATLPSDACAWVEGYFELPDPKTLVDGGLPAGAEYPYIQISQSHPPTTADLDGDGSLETILVIDCNAGGSGVTTEIHLYSSAGEYLDGLVVGDGVEGRPGLVDLGWGDGTLVVDTNGTRPGEALCCGTLPVRDTYAFGDGELELVDRVTG